MGKHRKNKRGYVQKERGVSIGGVWGGWCFSVRKGRVCYVGARKPKGQSTLKKQCRTNISRKIRRRVKQLLNSGEYDILPTKYDFDDIGWLD